MIKYLEDIISGLNYFICIIIMVLNYDKFTITQALLMLILITVSVGLMRIKKEIV